MKVLHTGSIDVNIGGPAMSTYLALKGLRDMGVDAQIAMFQLSPGGKLRGEEVPVHYLKPPISQKYTYQRTTKKEIKSIGDFDIYQSQGTWDYSSHALACVARKLHKPYLMTPRGMLYPQDIAKSNSLLKKTLLKLYVLNDFNHTACVHVTCMEEMKHCRDLGITSPMAVIPNPVEIKEYKETKKDDVFRIGYLGRLSPRKNVEGLIYAMDELRNETENTELLIIGGGSEVYEHFLRDEVERLGLKNVRFTGFLSGQEKDQALASCSILAMPSEIENLGNVILEGLVRCIPCIATKGAPWEDLQTYRCGWWVDYSQPAITDAIRQAYNVPQSELKTMGERGKQLMKDNYSVESIAKKMKATYEWILGKGEKPEFVYD